MEIEEKLDSMIKGYEKQNRGLGCLAPLPIVINDLKELKQSLPPKQEKVEVPEFVAEWYEYNNINLEKSIMYYLLRFNKQCKNSQFYRWIKDDSNNPIETLIRMKTDGYTVKELPTIHHLKIGLTYFKAVREGRKTFEIRKNDRDYKVGDILVLQEYTCGSYTDEECEVKVTYMTDYEQKDDYVVLGIVPVEEEAE